MKRLFTILFLLISLPLWATTYYVDSSAVNDSGDGSVGSPKKYIESGIALLTAGDTLIVNDGTYSTTSDQITNIPNGTAGNYVTIKAANDGGAIITAATGLYMAHDDAYIQVEGFKFNYASGKSIVGNHIKFLRCSFQGGAASGNVMNTTIGTSDYNDTEYILLEDCWAYGSGGRYNFLVYNSNYVILRRCVIRHDGAWAGADPEAGFNTYSSSYVYLQNCIAVDCDQTYTNWYSAFYATQDGSETENHWAGCIGINNMTSGAIYVDPKSAGSVNPFSITNSAFYGYNALSYGFSGGGQGSDTGGLTNVILGGGGHGPGDWNSGTPTITDSIVFDISVDKLDGVTASYCDMEGGGETCSNCQTYDPETNGLLYLTRIEAASNLKTAGTGGAQIGPTILYKIGTDGTLYGDSGWNTTTANSLWPWPNEDRIKTDMEAVSDRGFTAYSGLDGVHNTLTTYIWEYLGNQIPDDIYGSTPGITGGKITGGKTQ